MMKNTFILLRRNIMKNNNDGEQSDILKDLYPKCPINTCYSFKCPFHTKSIRKCVLRDKKMSS